jgi:glycosyltransferase involved in cell wall biosynthesis
MTVYNGERYLRESVESVLRQSFRDFEFVIVDDGSTDATPSILEECEKLDPRVRVTRRQHAGVSEAAVAGCARATGPLLARMDADDVALPTRFEQQVAFLETHPEVGVLGTRLEIIDEDGKALRTSDPPRSHALAAWRLLLWPAVAHPSVMMRRALLEQAGGYDTAFKYAADYELWTRLVEVTRFANLPATLVRYRVHEGMVTRRARQAQLEATDRIRRRFLARLLGREPPREQRDWLERLEHAGERLPERQIRAAIDLLWELYRAMLERGIIRHEEASEVRADIERRAVAAERRSASRGLRLPRRLRQWAARLLGSRQR